MSRPPSILVTRSDPDKKLMKKYFKKEKDGDHVRKLTVIRLMRKLQNAEQVAELLDLSAETVRNYVEAFNLGGLDELYKKKDQDEDPSSTPSNNTA